MALDFGILSSSLFPASAAEGDGMEANIASQLYAGKLILTEVSLAAEVTWTAKYETLSTFSLNIPNGAVVVGVEMEADLKNSATTTSNIGLKLIGANLGTKYYGSVSRTATETALTWAGTIDSTVMSVLGTTYIQRISNSFSPLKIVDEVTTLEVFSNSLANTGYIRNQKITLFIIGSYKEGA